MLEAALGKERAVRGGRALLEGARSGEIDLVMCSTVILADYVPEADVFFIPFLLVLLCHEDS